ncbi:MAG: ROK family protein [Cytophagales bacterium]
MKKAAFGIDIGGTYTKIGLVDEKGNILKESRMPTDEQSDAKIFVNTLAQELKAVLKSQNNNIQLLGIGLGAPNANYLTGFIEHAPNLPWKGKIAIVKEIQKHFNVPVIVTNDANAAAIGEMHFGKAKGMKDFAIVTLGTGLGSGFVSNGQLIYGSDGFAGELGHTRVKIDGRRCKCGKNGCFETYVSATGIKRTIFEFLSFYHQESKLRSVSYEDLHSNMIAEEAAKGDFIAQEAFRFTGRILGEKLADIVALFSPEAIFLFGGLMNAGDLILKPTKEHMDKNMLAVFANKTKLEISGLMDRNAAVLGASALIWDHYNLKTL